MIKKEHLLLLGGIVGIVILIGLYYFFYFDKSAESENFNAVATLEELTANTPAGKFLAIESSIDRIMREDGLRAGFLLIDEAEKQNIITNDQCHSLLHYVGHAGYATHPRDYAYLTSLVEGTSCIGGFIHGVEAEIVLTSDTMKKDLWDFCAYTIEAGVRPGACYHGVGHAGAELYNYDIQKTLAMCDLMEGGPEPDLTNCYRGTFSELGNIIIGVDGHTGLPIDKIGVSGLDPKNPYAYCQTFAEKYQSSCKSQLTKLLLGAVEMDEWLKVCADGVGMDESSQKICVNIASGVYVRETLSFQESTTLPADVNRLSKPLREIAVLGAIEAYSGYASDNDQVEKDWKSFCDTSFTHADDVTYCVSNFTDFTETGRAVWMERDDIR